MNYLEEFKQILRKKGIAESVLNLEDDQYVLEKRGETPEGEDIHAFVVPSLDLEFIFSNNIFRGLTKNMSDN
tara:strand:- start:58 stop:273 length:216 start_codon:yes stop_codon:yes gene_type:complete